MNINNLLNEDFIDDSLKTNESLIDYESDDIETNETNETDNVENIEVIGNIPESFIKEFLNS